MIAHLSFPGVTSFDQSSTWTVTVQKGTSFVVSFIAGNGEDVSSGRMATTEDKVLKVVRQGTTQFYDVSADAEGESELQLQTSPTDRNVVFWLNIKVVSGEASSLDMPAAQVSPIT